MKKISIAAAVIALAGPAMADVNAPGVDRSTLPIRNYVPTGYEVPGCTHYRTYPGGRTEQVCSPNDVKELLKDLQSGTVGAYSNAFNSPGGAGTGGE